MAAASVAAAPQISEDRRAAIKELIKENAGKFAFDGVVPINEGVTQGLILNSVRNLKDLVVYDKHDWAGNESKAYPEPIPWSKHGQPAIFVHQGPLPNGSKGGVVYADGKDSTARKWLVAFDSVANKVFVEAGPIGPTDWNVVEVKLNASGSESSYEDPVFHGGAHAEISPYEGRRSIIWISFFN